MNNVCFKYIIYDTSHIWHQSNYLSHSTKNIFHDMMNSQDLNYKPFSLVKVHSINYPMYVYIICIFTCVHIHTLFSQTVQQKFSIFHNLFCTTQPVGLWCSNESSVVLEFFSSEVGAHIHSERILLLRKWDCPSWSLSDNVNMRWYFKRKLQDQRARTK